MGFSYATGALFNDELSRPRTVVRHSRRANAEAETPYQYCIVAISGPYHYGSR